MSLPSRERGLKFRFRCCSLFDQKVAPLAGAWIEIPVRLAISDHVVSLPSRERGLKSQYCPDIEKQRSSLPSRERGLKFTFNLTIF